MSCIYTGAVVNIPDYGITAPADIFEVGNTYVVRFNGDPTDGPRDRQEVFRSTEYAAKATHILDINPPQGHFAGSALDADREFIQNHDIFIRLDLGIVAVTRPYLDAVDGGPVARK